MLLQSSVGFTIGNGKSDNKVPAVFTTKMPLNVPNATPRIVGIIPLLSVISESLIDIKSCK